MESILVTGCAGFVGWRTTQLLLERGHQVVGVDNLNDYYDPLLKRWRLASICNAVGAPDRAAQLQDQSASPESVAAGPFSFVRADLEDGPGLKEALAGHEFDAVINLAARAGVRYSMDHPEVYLRTNIMGLLHVMDIMRERGIQKLVQASTSSLYAGLPMPFVETLPVNQPISPYAASKKGSEALAYSYHHLYGLDISVVRYFTVYGPAGRPDMAPLRFVRWIAEGETVHLHGDGQQTRDFTFIDDIAEGTIRALKPLGYEVINLGGGKEPVSMNTMIEIFAQALGKEPVIERHPFHKADMVSTSADIRKARSLLGWEPVTGPREGFEATVEWYLKHRDIASRIKL